LPYFGDRSAAFLLEKTIDEYKDKRLAEGASKVTVNRELAVLKRAFSLGLKRRLIKSVPQIELFPEPPPREGHYEYEDFLKFQQVARAIGARKNFDGEVVADITLFAYCSGWRLNECLSLNKDWIKVRERLAIVPAQKHKNKRAKVLPLDDKLWEMIYTRYMNASPEGFLFHRNGKQIKSIRRLAATVCEIAGLDSAHFFHNLRRSFRTNLGRAGVDDQTGMKLMGHRTLDVYNNYNQIGLERMREALERMQKTLEPTLQEKKADRELEITLDSQEVVAEREGFEPPHDVRKGTGFSSRNSAGSATNCTRKVLSR
jgi:integrase